MVQKEGDPRGVGWSPVEKMGGVPRVPVGCTSYDVAPKSSRSCGCLKVYREKPSRKCVRKS